jgi:hypothetical protein
VDIGNAWEQERIRISKCHTQYYVLKWNKSWTDEECSELAGYISVIPIIIISSYLFLCPPDGLFA